MTHPRSNPARPRVLVALPIFAEVLAELAEHFEVDAPCGTETPIAWTPEALAARLQGCAGIFVAAEPRIDAALLDACPALRAVCSMAVGYNNIDVPACSARGVWVSNAPDVLTETTADLGFALMMAAARRIAESERWLRAGHWTHWRYDLFAGADVHGTTLGVLGMGRIGQAVARRGAKGFGMPVLYHNRSRLDPEIERDLGARWVGKDELLGASDHLVIVVPYSPASHHLIGAAELARMKPTATLTNIARGGIVDDAALAQALRERRIAAAGLDVYEGEPALHPGLLEVPNVVLTPHIGSSSLPTRRAMAGLAVRNLVAILVPGSGPPPTALNRPAPRG
jgi:gluconate 2-dehydrogenase